MDKSTKLSDVHYGSNGYGECGAGYEDDPAQSGQALATLQPRDVTCPRCRGWLPIVTRMDSPCECGHERTNHEALPGHPDGAEECYETEDCDCGRFRAAQVCQT